MGMVTRCPACSTLFRVTSLQLQAQHGRVRCGVCDEVFDGFRALEVEPEPVAEAVLVVDPAQIESTAVNEESDTYTDVSGRFGFGEVDVPATPEIPHPTGVAMPAPDARATVTSSEKIAEAYLSTFDPHAAASAGRAGDAAERRSDGVLRDAQPYPVGTISAAVRSPGDTSRDSDDVDDPDAGKASDESSTRRLRWPWAVGSVLLLLVLSGQGLYAYRGEIVSRQPSMRPVIQTLCEKLKCVLTLPQRPKSINIEASDLQALDTQRPGLIQLTATLRNHAGYDIAYPAIDLVLTNTREHTLARRIFLPRDYLAWNRDVAAGIAANAEFTVRLDLDTGELPASGFRIDLLPVPSD
jgi:predicted Zn finger-like uncharacterized protein